MSSALLTRPTALKASSGIRARPMRNRSATKVEAAAAAAPTQEKWINPAFHNKNLIRAIAIVGTAALASKGAVFLPSSAIPLMHLAAFSIWLGTNFYTTFVVGIVMFKNLPRQMFGKVQSRLFPIYFQLSAACLILTLGTAIAGGAAGTKELTTLGVALALTFVNLFALEPATTKNMFERYELENKGQQDSDASKSLKKKFGALHGLSSLINLGALVAGVSHLVWLAGKMLI